MAGHGTIDRFELLCFLVDSFHIANSQTQAVQQIGLVDQPFQLPSQAFGVARDKQKTISFMLDQLGHPSLVRSNYWSPMSKGLQYYIGAVFVPQRGNHYYIQLA